MANSTGTHSYGTTLGMDPAGGSSYTVIAEVIEITGPGLKVTTTKVANLSSPSASIEKRPGMADAGTLSLKCTWTKAQYAIFLTNVRKALMTFKITFPLVGTEVTASALTFAGHIAGVGLAVPEDDRITNEVEFEISGAMVFAAGA